MSFAQLPIASIREDGQKLPLSYAQERQWFLWQLEPSSAAYHIPMALRLRGQLDVAALQRSFDSLIERHQTLRTVFVHDGQRPQQEIRANAALTIVEQSLAADTADGVLQQLIESEIQQPFDLAEGPLLRVKLLHLGADDHVLILIQHHIVSDGWSMRVMVDELIALYAGFSSGTATELAALPIQYADYALWQRSWMEAGEKARQLAYWRELLGGAQDAQAAMFESAILSEKTALDTARAGLLADIRERGTVYGG